MDGDVFILTFFGMILLFLVCITWIIMRSGEAE